MDTTLVVVDRLSKFAHFINLKNPFSAAHCCGRVCSGSGALHGVPRSIVSDWDKVFMSKFWGGLYKLQGMELKHSTAYHPKTDG